MLAAAANLFEPEVPADSVGQPTEFATVFPCLIASEATAHGDNAEPLSITARWKRPVQKKIGRKIIYRKDQNGLKPNKKKDCMDL